MGALRGEAMRVEPPPRVGGVVMERREGLDIFEAVRMDGCQLRLHRRKFPRAVKLYGEGHASFPVRIRKRSIGYRRRRRERVSRQSAPWRLAVDRFDDLARLS
jgi:hypothetical protein